MYQVVKIGEKEVPMLSMASVDVYYRQIFHKDAIKLQSSKEFDEGDLINFVCEMGFVMAKFAELKDRKEIAKLTDDNYLEWLDQFDRAEFMAALPDVRMVYEGQQITHADSKKNEDLLTDK